MLSLLEKGNIQEVTQLNEQIPVAILSFCISCTDTELNDTTPSGIVNFTFSLLGSPTLYGEYEQTYRTFSPTQGFGLNGDEWRAYFYLGDSSLGLTIPNSSFSIGSYVVSSSNCKISWDFTDFKIQMGNAGDYLSITNKTENSIGGTFLVHVDNYSYPAGWSGTWYLLEGYFKCIIE